MNGTTTDDQTVDGAALSADGQASDVLSNDGGAQLDDVRADVQPSRDTTGTSADADPEQPVQLLHRAVDLDIGEAQAIELVDGKKVTVKLLEIQETHEPRTNAIVVARARVSVDAQEIWLTAATYNLPVTVADIQIDCPVVAGYPKTALVPGYPDWGLRKSARFRLWPGGSPLVGPGTFVYPLKQRWFAGDTWLSSEPVINPLSQRDKIPYHTPADIGGSEGQVELVAAANGVVIAPPGNDVVSIRSGPWRLQYFHMKTRDVKVGDKVGLGQKIGLLGKEGGSGGWAHLHFEINGQQPSGLDGEEMGYGFLWDAYMRQYAPPLVAVAGPIHHLMVEIGKPLTLEGALSRSFTGNIVKYEWASDVGPVLTKASVERTYDVAGWYSEVLKVTDAQGHVDYDFVKVNAYDPAAPDRAGRWIHATFFPTFGIKPGAPVTFKVRAFTPTTGQDVWDFGDGSPAVMTQSNVNTDLQAADGYAQTLHSFARAGQYLVRVERAEPSGPKSTTHLHVRVGE